MKGTWKEIMQKIKVNNRFATFPTMIKHEKHIDNRAKPSENSDELIPWLFGKKFGHKVFISHKKVHENAIIQNEKSQSTEKRYLWPAIARIFPVASIQKQSPEVFYKKVGHNNFEKSQENTCVGLFLIKLQA